MNSAVFDRPLRPYLWQTILVLCVGLLVTVHSLPSKLRIDPTRQGISSKISATDRPIRIDLRKAFNFNNRFVYSVWVHRDGFISLDQPPASMSSYPLNDTIRSFGNLKQNVISVYMARVASSARAIIKHRTIYRRDPENDCRTKNLIKRLEKEIHVLYPADKRFEIEQILVINWEELKFEKARDEKTNTFEVALVSDGEDSFVIFNFVDINWDRVPVEARETADPYPQIGLSSKERAYPLPINGKPLSENVGLSTNAATPGMWVFKTGKLRFTGEFKNPDVDSVRDRGTKEHLLAIRNSLGFGLTGDPCMPTTATAPKTTTTSPPVEVKLARRVQGVTCAQLSCPQSCRPQGNTLCCECRTGFIGSGYKCFNKTTFDTYFEGNVRIAIDRYRTSARLTMRSTRIAATNGNSQYVSYEHTGKPEDKVILRIMRIMLPVFVTPHWYAAQPVDGGVNAIQLSEMRLKRRTTVRIKGIGRFSIEQKVTGFEGRLQRGEWDTNITGNLEPGVNLSDISKQVTGLPKLITYRMTTPGRIDAEKMHTLKAGDRFYTVDWNEEIVFLPGIGCEVQTAPSSFTNILENVGFRYHDNTIYFMSQNVYVKSGAQVVNPCSYASMKCPGANEICVPTGPEAHNFACRCKQGFEMRDRRCVDMDECSRGMAQCPYGEVCVNTPGNYVCECARGFVRDGEMCRPVQPDCGTCSPNGRCAEIARDRYQCVCNAGYTGNGFECSKLNPCAKCSQPQYECDQRQCKCGDFLKASGNMCYDCTNSTYGPKCHRYAMCRHDDRRFLYRCICNADYNGDGVNECKYDICKNCDRNAECVDNSFCRCRTGYYDPTGNGFSCKKGCPVTCDRNAICNSNGQCECKSGFMGSGQACVYNCRLCDRNALCNPDSGCQCKEHFEGDGRSCDPKHECSRDIDCGAYGQCQSIEISQSGGMYKRICGCFRGYERIGGNCQRKKVKLEILPNERTLIVDEGDDISITCKITEGNIQINDMLWGKETQKGMEKLRRGMRIRRNSAKKLTDLRIAGVRPEDTGRYVCFVPSARRSIDLNVRANPCGRKCHPKALCDRLTRQCKCMVGSRGDGVSACVPETCSYFPDICDTNARCQDSKCICNLGYKLVGEKCEVIPTCRTLKNCHKKAHCVNMQGIYKCRCTNGYEGDGIKSCDKIRLGCDRLYNCVENAECKYLKIHRKSMCRCKEGYFGDGYLKCRKKYDCNKTPSECGPNSKCRKEVKYDDRSRSNILVGLCECNPGYKMINERCYKKSDLNTTIYLSQGSIIYQIPVVQTKEKNPRIWYSNVLKNSFSPSVVALATDCSERRVYWSSIIRGPSIFSSLEQKRGSKRVIARNARVVEGLAVDWIAGNIFYTSFELRKDGGVISVVTRNGTRTKVIAKTNVTNPRGIAVDPSKGKIYWTDWDRSNPRIESSNMDGSERKIVIDQLRNLPNGLIFDFEQERLCWVEADKQTIVNSTKILCLNPYDKNPTKRTIYNDYSGIPFGLAYSKPTFYYTDWSRRQLQSVTNGKRKSVASALRVVLSKMYGVAIMPEKCPRNKYGDKMTNACSRIDNNYGGCKYLCLPVPKGGKKCVCPDNNKNCTPTI